jgi:aspartate ammonia-lyase
VESSIGIVTALVPHIGYEAAAEIAKEALKSGRRVRDITLEQGILSDAQLKDILDPRKMTGPRALKEK